MLVCSELSAQEGYKIEVDIAGFNEPTAQLAYHYGNKQYIKDTIDVADGKLLFEGEEALDGGIYLVVLPPKNNYFEMIVGDDQHFKLSTNSTNLVEHMKVEGSVENTIFYDYLHKLGEIKEQSDKIDAEIKSIKGGKKEKELDTKSKERLKTLKAEKGGLQETLNQHRFQIMDEHPDLFYATVLKAMKEPKIPEAPKDANGNPIDSLHDFKYFKKHFFDDIDFSDQRLLRTPLLHNKLNQYLKQLVVRFPDSINVACDRMLKLARANDEVFKYALIQLLNKYANSKIMGMDAVYVYLVQHYYSKGDAPWVDSIALYKMEARARALSPTLVGKKTPNIIMKDMGGTYRNLHKVIAPYTVLTFWDPDCGHCKKTMPKLVPISEKYALKGVKVFAVCTEVEVEKWKKFVKEKGFENWINVSDPYLQNNFRSFYDIQSTPKHFLLDKDKKIIAKRISIAQIDEILADKLGMEPEKKQDGDLEIQDNLDEIERQNDH